MDLLTLITLATSVVPDRTLGFTVTVIVAGLGIVLGTLAVLIVVFYIFGAIMSKTTNAAKKKKQKSVSQPAPVKSVAPAPKPAAPAAPVVEDGISGEVVAAISAAVYSMEGGDAAITSIATSRKKNPITGRNPWAQAAVVNNTNPF